MAPGRSRRLTFVDASKTQRRAGGGSGTETGWARQGGIRAREPFDTTLLGGGTRLSSRGPTAAARRLVLHARGRDVWDASAGGDDVRGGVDYSPRLLRKARSGDPLEGTVDRLRASWKWSGQNGPTR